MGKRKNRVYFAISDEDMGGTYIAAPNIKIAKSIARSCDIILNHMEDFLDLDIHWCRGIETDYEGELDVFQINELGLSWWVCPNCDEEEFEILSEEICKCKKCGEEFEIPYIN